MSANFLNVKHVEYYKVECLHGVPDFKSTIGVVNKIPAHVRAFDNILLASVFFLNGVYVSLSSELLLNFILALERILRAIFVLVGKYERSEWK